MSVSVCLLSSCSCVPASACLCLCFPEIANPLRNTSNPQVEYILRVIKRWAKDNNINLLADDNMARARRDFSPGGLKSPN